MLEPDTFPDSSTYTDLTVDFPLGSFSFTGSCPPGELVAINLYFDCALGINSVFSNMLGEFVPDVDLTGYVLLGNSVGPDPAHQCGMAVLIQDDGRGDDYAAVTGSTRNRAGAIADADGGDASPGLFGGVMALSLVSNVVNLIAPPGATITSTSIDQIAPPEGLLFPLGVVGFSATVTTSLNTFTEKYPCSAAITEVYKPDATGAYVPFGMEDDGTGAVVLGSEGGVCVAQVTIMDNGRGDTDPVLGQVTDPFGLAAGNEPCSYH